MDTNPTVKWWFDQAKDVYRQAIFSELYGFQLFVEKSLDGDRKYYEFQSDELGDAVWLSQKNLHKQEYEIVRVEEGRKLHRIQPHWPFICRFWDEGLSIDVHELSRTSVPDITKKVIEAGKRFARGINPFFVEILMTSSANSKILEHSLGLDDLLAQGSDELSSKGFTADRFLFPKGLQHRLIQGDLIIPNDKIKNDYYVGKTKTGLYAFGSNELPKDTGVTPNW